MTNSDDDIDARPTKALFIEMLTKDISLIRAILDLVDNSVDGARRLRPDENYKGLWIELEISKNGFKISDNCGGMSVKTAREYAFRFGRSEDAPETPGSVGQFGVGMKRAFFKIGKYFKVESSTKNNHFILEADVDKWEKEEGWKFHFKEYDEQIKNPTDSIGTIISVTSLNENIGENFSQENFRTRLAQELSTAHLISMNNGLQISLNRNPLQMSYLVFKFSKQIKPVFKEIEFKDKEHPVNVKIYAGLTESVPKDAGWYVFCNGRMLLEREKTKITGWGEKEGQKIPQYHQQFAMFRGYVFFESDNAELLPWNTTKTGVDVDSPIYQSVRLEMINLWRPIMDFLNVLKESKDKDDEKESPLEKIVTSAKTYKLEDIENESFTNTFEAPKFKEKEKNAETVLIKYNALKKQADIVKKSLGAKSWGEVGEKTFEYYLKTEGDE